MQAKKMKVIQEIRLVHAHNVRHVAKARQKYKQRKKSHQVSHIVRDKKN